MAEGFVVGDVPVAGYRDLTSGNFARFDVVTIQMRVDVFQMACVQAGRGGVDVHDSYSLSG
jgi:hypothetical protein